ncbi:MAG: hypothetical protein MJ211_00135 [Bacteroidales bacterium]|nr:hypothetical protein [Bacteroidales bacterium]
MKIKMILALSIATLLASCSSNNNQNSNQATSFTPKTAKEAVQIILNQWNKEITDFEGEEQVAKNQPTHFTNYDIDGDGINEMIICHLYQDEYTSGPNWTAFCTNNSEGFKLIAISNIMGQFGDLALFDKTIRTSFGNESSKISGTKYFTFENSKVSLIYTDTVEIIDSENSEDEDNEENWTDKYTIFDNNKQSETTITAEEYDSFADKLAENQSIQDLVWTKIE